MTLFKEKLTKLSVFYIITMSIIFITRYVDFEIGNKLQFVISFFWILVFIKTSKKNEQLDDTDFKFFLKLYLFPHIIIHLYTIILMIFGTVEWRYLTTNLTVYLPTILALFSIRKFGYKAYKYNLAALLLAWIISVSLCLAFRGPTIFSNAVMQAYFDSSYLHNTTMPNYLEIHDIVLALGYIVIYFFYESKKVNKSNIIFVILVILIGFLGMKRISILGIVVVLIIHFIMKRLKIKNTYKICLISGIMAILLCYSLIYILSTDNTILQFLNDHHINLMGRQYYFEQALKLSNFSPFYLGIGRNALTQLFATELSYLKVLGVHSDIIKMYVECGFVLFGLWLYYKFIFVTKKYSKRFNFSSAVLYFYITVYMFILYLTDNTETYFICQIFSILVPVSYAIKKYDNLTNNTILKDKECFKNNEYNKTIGIIIPAYNCEKYLKRCLNSVVNQTYKNLEIILVDDGSTDSTKEICMSYAKVDNRIKYYYKKNGGPSSARNFGINKVSSEYIMFIDSDDYIALDMVEKMSKYVNKNDVVICNYIMESHSSTYYNGKRFVEYQNVDEFLILNSFFGTTGKLFRKSKCNIKFDEEKRIAEDMLFWYQNSKKLKTYYFINEDLYHYCFNDESIMHFKNIDKNVINSFSTFEYIIENTKNDNIKKYMKMMYLWHYNKYLDYPNSNELTILNKNKNKYYDEIMKLKSMKISEKLKLYFIYKWHSLYKFLKGIKI